MKKLMILSVSALAIAACQNDAAPETQTPMPVEQTTPQTTSSAQTVADANAQMAGKPVTVKGGSGSTCLAVDVLANDGAFIRAGTAGSLSGDVFTVNGVGHDMSGINYSVKGC